MTVQNQREPQTNIQSRRESSLAPQQQSLREELRRLDPRLEHIYLGVVAALDSDFEESIPQAAHSLRELMDRLPEFLAVPLAVEPPPLGSEVRNLATVWRTVDSAVHRALERAEAISESLADFLHSLGRFFDGFEQDRPTRRMKVRQMMRQLDPARGGTLPVGIEEDRARAWMDAREEATSIAHHGRTVVRERLVSVVSVVEGLLLDVMSPRTVDNWNELEALVREGEK